jgi:hypothetical protein
MNKAFQIAIILLVPADTYEEAMKVGESIAENLATDAGVGVMLETNYERDGSIKNQRVVYLHDEADPIDLDKG